MSHRIQLDPKSPMPPPAFARSRGRSSSLNRHAICGINICALYHAELPKKEAWRQRDGYRTPLMGRRATTRDPEVSRGLEICLSCWQESDLLRPHRRSECDREVCTFCVVIVVSTR